MSAEPDVPSAISDAAAPTSPPPIPAASWRILAVTSVSAFMVFLDTTIVNIAFPAIAEDFPAASPGTLSWVLNAYTVVFAALLLPAGKLGDRIGRRRIFLLGLVVFGIASAACGVAPSLGALIGARALQAVGGALLVPTSLALLLPAFPFARRSLAVGLWGATAALAAAVGPTVGGVLVTQASWHWVFAVNVPITVVAVALGARILVESQDGVAAGLPDLFGVLLAAGAVGSLSLAIVQGPAWGWGSPGTLAALAAATLMGPWVVRRSRRHPVPIIDLDLFGSGPFSAIQVATLLFAVAFYARILSGVVFLIEVWDQSALSAALLLTPAPLLAALLAGPAGAWADRYGHRAVILPGTIAFAAANLWWLALLTTTTDLWVAFMPGVMLSGVGIGLALPTLGGASASALQPARFGSGSAVNGAVRQVGAVLGVAAVVALLQTQPGLAGFQGTWWLAAGSAAAAGVAVARIGPRITPTPSS